MATLPSLQLSDSALENFHPDFGTAIVRESSKRSASGAPETRQKVRMVVYDTVTRTIAIIRKSETDEYELPGGARKSSGKNIEKGLRAARRELREELGLRGKMKISRIGECREERARLDLVIETSCYLVVVDGAKPGKTKLSRREEAAGWSGLWLPANRAMAHIAHQEHDSYTAVFEQYRNMWLLGIALARIAQEHADH